MWGDAMEDRIMRQSCYRFMWQGRQRKHTTSLACVTVSSRITSTGVTFVRLNNARVAVVDDLVQKMLMRPRCRASKKWSASPEAERKTWLPTRHTVLARRSPGSLRSLSWMNTRAEPKPAGSQGATRRSASQPKRHSQTPHICAVWESRRVRLPWDN